MTGLYDTDAEARAHEDVIESLVAESRMPRELVRSVYERELVRLKPGARVKDYLLLLAERKARERLRSTPR
jgi:hypothetical protein